jgi:hypothetical protein
MPSPAWWCSVVGVGQLPIKEIPDGNTGLGLRFAGINHTVYLFSAASTLLHSTICSCLESYALACTWFPYSYVARVYLLVEISIRYIRVKLLNYGR